MTILNKEEVDYLRGLIYFVEPNQLRVLSAFLDHGNSIEPNTTLLDIIIQLKEVLDTVDTDYAKSISIKLLGHLVKRWE